MPQWDFFDLYDSDVIEHSLFYSCFYHVVICPKIQVPQNYKFPCGICTKALRKNQNGIFCDGSGLWHLLPCLNMAIEVFNEHAQNSNQDWYWDKCILPQFSDPFFDSSSLSRGGPEADSRPDAEEEEQVYIRELKQLKCKQSKSLVFAHVNINSFRNKYMVQQEILYDKLVDVLICSETKLDNSFPDAQFRVDGYTLYRKDRDSHGGGLILFIRSDFLQDRGLILRLKLSEVSK